VMKMSGWEDQFSERIAEVRTREMERIQKANRLKAVNDAIFFCTSVIVSIVIFLVHVFVMEGSLSSSIVFTVLSMVNLVQFNITKFFTLAVMGVSECYVSVKRIQAFLDNPELAPVQASEKATTYSTEQSNSTVISSFACSIRPPITALRLSNVSAIWPSGAPALSSLDLTFSLGTLTCLIGPVGSGKSALLQLLARELPLTSGEYCSALHSSTLSYSSQDAWIMNGSIRDNIILDRYYDIKNYNRVMKLCGLDVDVSLLSHGDVTVVGDRGVQLSGGQKARIALARCLYRDASVILLDDPLSAVDGQVGRGIFEGILEEVARGKCVVLATHRCQYLSGQRCVLMDEGQVSCVGIYEEIVEKSSGVLEQWKVETKDEEEKVEVITDEQMVVVEDDNDDVYKESRNVGVVKLSTWIAYGKALGGWGICVLLFLLFTVTQGSFLLIVTLIGKWSEDSIEEQRTDFYLYIVSSLGLALLVFACVRALLSFYFAIKASQRLHNSMTTAVLRARISFFDTNPIGRILNRFSADVGSNDDLLPQTMFDFLMTFFMVIGGIATAFSVLPFTLLALPPLMLYFFYLRGIFLTVSRELKRLEAMSRSPIFAMISESLSGIATIRANAALPYFRRQFETVHDAHTRAFFSFLAASRWLGIRMDGIMFLLTSACSVLAVFFHDVGWFDVDPAVVGLALTMLMQLAGTFQWCVRQSAEIVNQMVSVERVSAFSALESEAPLNCDKDQSLNDWPVKGDIEVEDITLRYRPSLPPSLKNVSFVIRDGERVGVVGRTGSGKSTLVQALFRIIELEKGRIILDGEDISTIGLHKLRTALSVIPQHPVLFSGCTVRENLDPFRKFSDSVIKSALEDVQMWDTVVKNDDKGLESLVAEGGSNFSVGQRQLICLARAILTKSKILILDEPTANVDTATDTLLQKALRKKFSKSTILAVAHRLDTVIDYDKILVLGDGKVLEFGSPKELLKDACGAFYRMVDDCGDFTACDLRRMVNEGGQMRDDNDIDD